MRTAIATISAGVCRRPARAMPMHAAATSLANVAGVPSSPAAIRAVVSAAAATAIAISRGAARWVGALPGADRLDQLDAGEVEPAEVVGGDAGRQAGGDLTVVRRPPLSLAVVVRAVAPGQEAETVAQAAQRAVRVGDAGLEPAQRAGAHPAQDDPRLPGLAQRRVDAVGAPDREHVHGVAAADVDHVLG